MSKTDRTYFVERGPVHSWKPEHDAQIRRLAGEGFAASAIAQRLFDVFGIKVSRSAVIGRASRIKAEFLSARSVQRQTQKKRAAKVAAIRVPRQTFTPEPKRPAAVPAPVAKPEPAPEIVEAFPEAHGFDPIPGISPVRFMGLDAARKMCRWPVSGLHGSVTHFCGATCRPGLSYCPSHAALSRGKGTASERNAVSGIKDRSIIAPPRKAEPAQPDIVELFGVAS